MCSFTWPLTAFFYRPKIQINAFYYKLVIERGEAENKNSGFANDSDLSCKTFTGSGKIVNGSRNISFAQLPMLCIKYF